MQNIIGSEKFSRENRDPPYPSLYREGMLVIEKHPCGTRDTLSERVPAL